MKLALLAFSIAFALTLSGCASPICTTAYRARLVDESSKITANKKNTRAYEEKVRDQQSNEINFNSACAL